MDDLTAAEAEGSDDEAVGEVGAKAGSWRVDASAAITSTFTSHADGRVAASRRAEVHHLPVSGSSRAHVPEADVSSTVIECFDGRT